MVMNLDSSGNNQIRSVSGSSKEAARRNDPRKKAMTVVQIREDEVNSGHGNREEDMNSRDKPEGPGFLTWKLPCQPGCLCLNCYLREKKYPIMFKLMLLLGHR